MALKNDSLGDDFVFIWIHMDAIWIHMDAMLIAMKHKRSFIKKSDKTGGRILFWLLFRSFIERGNTDEGGKGPSIYTEYTSLIYSHLSFKFPYYGVSLCDIFLLCLQPLRINLFKQLIDYQINK